MKKKRHHLFYYLVEYYHLSAVVQTIVLDMRLDELSFAQMMCDVVFLILIDDALRRKP